MKKVLSFIVVVMVLAGLGYGAYTWRSRAAPAEPQYRTAAVRRADVVATITATGTVVPEEVVDVGAQINGQIASFGADESGKTIDYRSTVEEGGVLARIDDALYAADVATSEAQLKQAGAQVRSAEANREQTRARLAQAKLEWARAQQLDESKDISNAERDAAKSVHDQAIAAVSVSDAAIAQGQAAIAIAEASLLRSRRNLAYCIIKSPVSGVIIDRRVDIGQTVVASLNAPSLFLIAKDLRRMQVLVQVNEADIGHVTPGQPVTFTVDAFPGEPFRGDVRKVRLNATMTQNVVTYTVEIVTDNKELKLLPYLTANVRFETGRRDDAVVVPNAALRWSPPASAADAAAARAGGGGRATGAAPASPAQQVWVLEDGKPKRIAVKSELSDGTVTAVTSDELAEGVEVVVGEVSVAAARSGGAGSPSGSPFAPPMMGGRGGGGGGGRPR